MKLMYKIKHNVDLKELENFRFRKFKFPLGNNVTVETEYRRYYDFEYPNAVTSIDDTTKIIENWDDSITYLGIPNDEELLEDLIKADMVEKVEE